MRRLGLVAVMLSGVLAGCGDQCAETCTGCCREGVCIGGTLDNACGIGGATCDKCRDGSHCDATMGQCVGGAGGGSSSPACGNVTTAGICQDATTAQYCFVPTGNESPRLVTTTCTGGDTCSVQNGQAQCRPTGACRNGNTRCANASSIEVCSNGQWAGQSCQGGVCVGTQVGSVCAPNVQTQMLTGSLQYEGRNENASFSDWGALTTRPVRRILVVSTVGTDVLAAAITDDQGRYTIAVPKTPGSSDRIGFVALHDDGQGGIGFVLADPKFSSGGRKDPFEAKNSSALWLWGAPTTTVLSTPDLLIAEANGSAALKIYDDLTTAYEKARTHYGTRLGRSLVVWMGLNTTWSCGNCFVALPTGVADAYNVESQMFLGGGTDQSYWGGAVTTHELGHWVMASYGQPPDEGGMHVLGLPTFPGQAWQEGFATWFSSDTRRSPRYFDKQQGSFFWIDLVSYRHDEGALTRPTPAGGLLQKMDENVLSGMLYALSTANANASGAILDAIASPQMKKVPFEGRGYTRHEWTLVPDQNGNPTFANVVDTRMPRPVLPDLFDAMVCAGFPAAQIDAATQPQQFYPYPSRAPLCE